MVGSYSNVIAPSALVGSRDFVGSKMSFSIGLSILRMSHHIASPSVDPEKHSVPKEQRPSFFMQLLLQRVSTRRTQERKCFFFQYLVRDLKPNVQTAFQQSGAGEMKKMMVNYASCIYENAFMKLKE